MEQTRLGRFNLFGIGLLMMSAALTVYGQTAQVYPIKPVTIIVPYPPGSSTETEARLYAKRLQESLKQSFLVDFKAGAGSTIGTGYVGKAAADGYTLLASTAAFSVVPAVRKDMPYDPVKDFAPASLMSERPAVVVTSLDAGKDFRDFVANARKNPGKVNFGTTGAGGLTHVAGAYLGTAAGIPMTFVHYKGNAQGYLDLVANRVQAMVGPLNGVLPLAKAGKVRIVGVVTPERTKAAPDLPTIAEQGVPGFSYSSWFGIIATGGTPATIVAKLSAELSKAVQHPESIEWLSKGGAQPIGGSPEHFRKHIATEIEKWTRVAKEANIQGGED